MEVGRVRRTTISSVRSKDAVASESIHFQSIMDKKQNEATYERLSQKVAEIEEQGQKLSETQTIENLRKYKKMVKEFLQDVVTNGLELTQRYGFNQRGSAGLHKLVKEVDKKLINLTNEVLEKEKKPINITNLVGEIKGLLINIYT
jgi:uncharacterized protein